MYKPLLLVLIALLWAGCGAEDTTTPDPLAEELAMFDEAPTVDVERRTEDGKEDGLGALGPAVGGHESTAVWDVRNQWTDTDTPEARLAGLAWDADSGLTWEEKYRLWVASLPETDGTFTITNPWGVTLGAPVLECAEVAYFLRATFASWYHLPFFVEARDAQGGIYLGHFGFIRRDGSRYNNAPRYARLADYSGDHAHGATPAEWPTDSRLASRGLYGGGDEVPFLGDGARAGAYFDAFYLNKRTGYFMLSLLAYFGTVHLADTTITFHLQPEAIQAGDVLLERWQRRGIGHTIPIMRAEEVIEGRFEVQVASGSMPRRQPRWEDAASSRHYFTMDNTGGVGESYDGEPYAELGGGLRRWRIAVNNNGRWQNTVPPESREFWINSSDLDSISARPARFEEILAAVSVEEQVEVLTNQIEAKRAHLERYPASCSARIAREDAFDSLYELLAEEEGMTPAQVDAQYRTLADYVFAELTYPISRTCCWNSSTSDMYRIVMDYNREQQADMCIAPTVFMMREGGYEVFRAYAEARGEGDLWVDWSADEACPQATTVTTDTEAEHAWTNYCELGEVADPEPDPGTEACDDGDDDQSTATPLAIATPIDARICASDDDYYTFTLGEAGRITLEAAFSHSAGDLELELLSEAGERIVASTSSNDNEAIERELAAGTYFARVWGYNGAQADYRIDLTTDVVVAPETDLFPGAIDLALNTLTEGSLSSGERHVYRVDTGALSATLTFTHANGDLDLKLYDASGEMIHQSQGTTDTEVVEGEGTSPLYLEVYGYGDAAGDYSIEAR